MQCLAAGRLEIAVADLFLSQSLPVPPIVIWCVEYGALSWLNYSSAVATYITAIPSSAECKLIAVWALFIRSGNQARERLLLPLLRNHVDMAEGGKFFLAFIAILDSCCRWKEDYETDKSLHYAPQEEELVKVHARKAHVPDTIVVRVCIARLLRH